MVRVWLRCYAEMVGKIIKDPNTSNSESFSYVLKEKRADSQGASMRNADQV
jgi:hypothetical protein